MQEPKQDKNANTKTDRQQTAVKNLSRNGKGIAASPLDPLVQQVSRMGNAPNPSAHAAILSRAPANQQSSNRQLLLQLQQQYGNPYVNKVLQLARGMGEETPANTTKKPLMQAKLTIGSVGDKYEQEADRMAQQVVQRMNAPSQSDRGQAIQDETMPEAELQKKPEISTIQRQEMPEEKEIKEQQAEVKQETASLQLQKKCGGCEKKEESNLAQMKPETGTFPQEEIPKDEENEELMMQPLVEHQPAEGGMAATPKLETSIQQKRGRGQPLSDKLREPMEQAFGKDFSGVRVHADAQSDQINRSIQARAFTTGKDIFFRQGEYASGSKQGQELLAHELTHVVQQNGSAIKAKTEEGVTLSELSPDARVQRLCSNCEKEEKAENTLQAKEVSSGTLAVAPEPEVSISQVTQPAIQRVFDDLPDKREPKAPKQEKDKQPEVPEDTAESDTSDCDQQGDANKAQPEAPQGEQKPEKCPSEKEDKGEEQSKPEKTKPLKDKLSEKPATCVRQEQNPILQAFAATPNITARSAITTLTNTSTPQQNLQATGETASPETATEKVQATTSATEAQRQLRTTDAEVARLASSKINFKLPQQEGTNTDNNAAALEEQRATACSMASNFFTEAALRIQTVTGLGQSISARINGVVENAKASVMSTVQQQKDAVAAQINEQRTQVNSQEQGSIAEIHQQYQATLTNISLRTAEVSQRIQTEYSNAFQKVDQGETNLLSRVDQLYFQTFDQYIAAGEKVGNEATAVGEKWAKQWKSEITHKYDDLDPGGEDLGHGRSTRPDARQVAEGRKNGKLYKKASTAEEVAKQYKEQVTEEATKQGNNLVKGKAKDIKGICCGIKEFRKQLQKQQEETLKAVIDLQQHVVSQVTEAKAQLTESVNQTLQAALQSLDEQETAQLQILQGYGDRQVLAIERDAQKAIASLQKGVNQAANKLLTALQDYYSEFQGMEAPNPDELSLTLAEILGQFDNSIATVQKETEKGIAASVGGITQGEQQAVGAVGAIAQTGIEESAAVVKEAKTSFTNLDRGITNTFNQLRDAYTEAANKFVEDTAKGLAKITQNSQNPLEQIYQKLSEALQTSVTQIETGLRDTLKCLETDIQNYAAKAVEDEPWWKTLLKALVFIAVIVVAIVLAPIGIGFVAGAVGGGIAATIFAGVVVGAALGAGLGALSQIANNAIDGKNLMDGVGKAALGGAIGGAIGGLGGGLGGALVSKLGTKLGERLSKTLAKFGIETVFDTVGNIFGDLATGNPITWEGVLMGAAIGAGTYVATTKGNLRRLGKPGKKILSFQERSSKAAMRGGAFAGGKIKTTFGGKVETSPGRRSGVDVASAKPPEAEVKAPKTSVPGSQGVDIPTVSRPDTDVAGVKPLETEIKAPDTEKTPETVTPGIRSTHYDEPEIEPGVIAKEKTADGHEIKVLKDGRIVRCTTCAEIREEYKDELVQNPELTKRLNDIEGEPDGNKKVQRANKLVEELQEMRKLSAENSLSEFGKTLPQNSVMKKIIDEVMEAHQIVLSYKFTEGSGNAIHKFDELENLLGYIVTYQVRKRNWKGLGNLVHELTHISVDQRYQQDFVNLKIPQQTDSVPRAEIESGYLRNAEARQLYWWRKDNNNESSFRLGNNLQNLEDSLNVLKSGKIAELKFKVSSSKLFNKISNKIKLLNKLTKVSGFTPQQIEVIHQKLNYGKSQPHLEYDTVLNQILVWLNVWRINPNNRFYKQLEAAASEAYERRVNPNQQRFSDEANDLIGNTPETDSASSSTNTPVVEPSSSRANIGTEQKGEPPTSVTADMHPETENFGQGTSTTNSVRMTSDQVRESFPHEEAQRIIKGKAKGETQHRDNEGNTWIYSGEDEKGRHVLASETNAPSGSRSDVGTETPRGLKPDADVAMTPREREILENTAPKDGDELTPEELKTELEVAGRVERKLINEGEYVEEIQLPNGHKLKQRRSDGGWCRFSNKKCFDPKVQPGETPKDRGAKKRRTSDTTDKVQPGETPEDHAGKRQRTSAQTDMEIDEPNLETSPNGNCLYEAVDIVTNNSISNIGALREAATQFVIQNRQNEGLTDTLTRSGVTEQQLLETLSTNGLWAGASGDLVPYILASALERRLIIIREGNTTIVDPLLNIPTTAPPIFIYLHESHYTVRPTTSDQASQFATFRENQLSDIRTTDRQRAVEAVKKANENDKKLKLQYDEKPLSSYINDSKKLLRKQKLDLYKEALDAPKSKMNSVEYISSKTGNSLDGRGGSYSGTYKKEHSVESNHFPPQDAYKKSQKFKTIKEGDMPAAPMLYYHHRGIKPSVSVGGASSTGGSTVNSRWAEELASIMDGNTLFMGRSGYAAAMLRDAIDVLNVTAPNRGFYVEGIIQAAEYAVQANFMTKDDFVWFVSHLP